VDSIVFAIAGRGLGTRDEYLEVGRAGRERRLGAAERELVWTAWKRQGHARAGRGGREDRGDRDDWWATEQRKLFVAMTRARDRLALVATPPLADRLEHARERCDEWDLTA
jgi:hypothetical protein